MQDPNAMRSLLQGGQSGTPDQSNEPPPEPQTGAQAEPEAAPQLEISDAELNRLANKVDSDFQGAINDHQRRMQRNRRFYYLWRSRIGQGGGEALKSNFKVPFTEWQLLGMLAKQADALFGDDAQIVAVPTIPDNAKLTGKIGDYMTWRVFESMGATRKIIEFNFIKLMFGRAHAFMPYINDTFMEGSKEVTDYEGPAFEPLMPDDFIVPAERVRDLHQFSWCIRRCYPTPDELLEGEAQGKYFGITDNIRNIVIQSQNKRPRDNRTDQVREIKEIFEGVNYYFAWSWGEILEVYEWYGHWRMLRDPNADAELNDLDARELRRTELKVSYIPQLKQVIGVQKLADLYPRMRYRRPFVESSCLATGEYWGKGIPEMCEDVELEMTAVENIATEAAERAMSPMLGVRPRAGQKFRNARVEPGGILELDDPQHDVNVIRLVTDNQTYAQRQQALQSYGERVTGLSDQSMGRSPTRASADQPARTSILQAQNESVRLGLDYTVLREDWKIILERIWMLDCLYGPPEMFFRVTGKSPQGLYDIDHGFGRMTAEERAGRFDFDIRFATSEYSKEAKKQALASIGTLALQTPLFAPNLPAQWHVLADQYQLVDIDLSEYIPKPPMPETPLDPDHEWHLMLQAQSVHVHPNDQDAHHLIIHEAQKADMIRDHTGVRDEEALKRLFIHIAEHHQQIDRKILVAQQTQAVMAIGNLLGQNPGALGASHFGPGGQLGAGQPQQLGPGGPGQASQPAPLGEASQPNLNAPTMGSLAS